MRHILLLTCVVTIIVPLGAQEPAKRRRDIERYSIRRTCHPLSSSGTRVPVWLR